MPKPHRGGILQTCLSNTMVVCVTFNHCYQGSIPWGGTVVCMPVVLAGCQALSDTQVLMSSILIAGTATAGLSLASSCCRYALETLK